MNRYQPMVGQPSTTLPALQGSRAGNPPQVGGSSPPMQTGMARAPLAQSAQVNPGLGGRALTPMRPYPVPAPMQTNPAIQYGFKPVPPGPPGQMRRPVPVANQQQQPPQPQWQQQMAMQQQPQSQWQQQMAMQQQRQQPQWSRSGQMAMQRGAPHMLNAQQQQMKMMPQGMRQMYNGRPMTPQRPPDMGYRPSMTMRGQPVGSRVNLQRNQFGSNNYNHNPRR
jgi:hypothetical protein